VTGRWKLCAWRQQVRYSSRPKAHGKWRQPAASQEYSMTRSETSECCQLTRSHTCRMSQSRTSAYEITNSIEQSPAFLGNLIFPQLIQKSPTGTAPRFISEFAKARHLFLSWARWIQSTPFHPPNHPSIPTLYITLRTADIFCSALKSFLIPRPNFRLQDHPSSTADMGHTRRPQFHPQTPKWAGCVTTGSSTTNYESNSWYRLQIVIQNVYAQ
jgi:hypothetical protein